MWTSGGHENLVQTVGFAESDIQVLMSMVKLTPLGDPAPNAPKWFVAVETIRLAADQDWLHKATNSIAKYWRQKRERRMTHLPFHPWQIGG